MSAQLIPFPRRQAQEVPPTFEALRFELGGVSPRFLRYRIAEGMPSLGFDYRGRRIFLASECRAWLDERQKRMGRN